MSYDLDFDLEAKNSFFDFVAAGGIVFHKHTLIFPIIILSKIWGKDLDCITVHI